MSVVELHPDELLDKKRRGELDADEERRLDAYLRAHPELRFELLAMEDFAEEIELPEQRQSLVELMVSDVVANLSSTRALREPFTTPREPSGSPGPEPDAGQPDREVGGGAGAHELELARRRRRRRVAAAVLLVAASAAAGGGFLLSRGHGAPEETAPGESLPSESAPKERRAPVAPVPTTADPEPDDVTPVEPAEATPVRKAAPAPSAAVAEKPSAAELFSRANAARRSGDTDRAVALYRQLQRAHPDSSEAKVSRATMARLLLDSKKPDEALEKYDEYLDEKGGKGTLSEEAIVGRARALQRLGRKAEERAAWQQLLREYPRSVHAARARQRLREL